MRQLITGLSSKILTPLVVITNIGGANSVGTYGMVMYKTATGSWTEIADATATFKVYIQPSLTVDYDISVDYKKRYL